MCLEGRVAGFRGRLDVEDGDLLWTPGRSPLFPARAARLRLARVGELRVAGMAPVSRWGGTRHRYRALSPSRTDALGFILFFGALGFLLLVALSPVVVPFYLLTNPRPAAELTLEDLGVDARGPLRFLLTPADARRLAEAISPRG